MGTISCGVLSALLFAGCGRGMRKVLAVLAPLALAVAVSGCGEGTDSTGPTPMPDPAPVSLTGVVRSNGGGPLTGATVRILDGVNVGQTVSTNANGAYRFEGLAVGNANLSAAATGYHEARAGVHIDGSNTLDLTLEPAPPELVSLTGTVRSKVGSPLAGATVRILDGVNAGKTATTNVNGAYKFDDLAVGNGNLAASAVGYQESRAGVYINGSNTLDFALELISYDNGWWYGSGTGTASDSTPVSILIEVQVVGREVETWVVRYKFVNPLQPPLRPPFDKWCESDFTSHFNVPIIDNSFSGTMEQNRLFFYTPTVFNGTFTSATTMAGSITLVRNPTSRVNCPASATVKWSGTRR